MARFKGANLLNLRTFAEARFGADAWTRMIAALPPEDQPAARAIVAVGWYDLGLQTRILHAFDRVLAGGDRAVLVEFGRYDAERDLTGPQRLFLRLANPAYVLEKAGD